MKLRCWLFLTIITLVFNPLSAFAGIGNVISDVSMLDLSAGQIPGEKAEYYFMIPSSWQGKINAEREKLDSATLLEKIDFYYKPSNQVFKPVFFFSLFVYDKNEWNDNLKVRKLLETDRYVFCVYATGVNPFAAKADKEQFQRLISDGADSQFMKNCIVLAEGNQVLSEYTVTVNGRLLEGSKVKKKNSVLYLPLRSVCEALDYRIGWSESEKVILLLRGSFYFTLHLNNNTFNAYMEDGKTYVSSLFFIQILKTNVEIDDRYNVYIRE